MFGSKMPSPEYMRQMLKRASRGELQNQEDIIALGDIPLSNGDVIKSKNVREALEFISAGGTVGAVRNYSASELEAAYALAKSYLENGEYESGHKLCQFLCLQDHLNPRYWLAFGISQVRLQRLDQALQSFSMGAAVGGNIPDFPLHCAEIHLQRDDFIAAQSGAEMALAYLNVSTAHDPELARRARAILSTIKRRASNTTPKSEDDEL